MALEPHPQECLVRVNSANVSVDPELVQGNLLGSRSCWEKGTDVNFAATEKSVLKLHICWILRDHDGPR